MHTSWHKLVTPREDLRTGRPLDASEFAVHLDRVRTGQAPEVYRDPAQFFERTYLTEHLADFAAEVLRRLSGVHVATSAVFHLTTPFGGGKTHALTLLYHLARGGPGALQWHGVPELLQRANLARPPQADVAVFVGTEFDSITGRGGGDGTPLRRTPWGEIAWQLRGEAGFRLVAEHDRQGTAPGNDVLERLIPGDRPTLLLMDELLNYVSRYRKQGLAQQLYNFIHALVRWAPGKDNVVVVVALPASTLEMNEEDEADYERYKKVLDAVGKAVTLSGEADTAEIIRRRLFEWSGLPEAAASTIDAYKRWFLQHRQQLPTWFPVDTAERTLAKCYPFHPSLLSVFERKWQSLPHFQRTRGVLRMLALWIAHGYRTGWERDGGEPLIGLGTAPLDESIFRDAVIEQLGEDRLRAVVEADIIGRDDSHALRLDDQAADSVRERHLHRKVATAVFFESNGGQLHTAATLPEVRLAVGEPDLEIGLVEQCLENLVENCYYLTAQGQRYRFSIRPNLNKLLADRQASIRDEDVRARCRTVVQQAFGRTASTRDVERVPFPERTTDVPDTPVLKLVVLPPEMTARDGETTEWIERLLREHGSSART
ncbi:MAG: ATP-binding protein, partial [Planctomycetota bacterium]